MKVCNVQFCNSRFQNIKFRFKNKFLMIHLSKLLKMQKSFNGILLTFHKYQWLSNHTINHQLFFNGKSRSKLLKTFYRLMILIRNQEKHENKFLLKFLLKVLFITFTIHNLVMNHLSLKRILSKIYHLLLWTKAKQIS